MSDARTGDLVQEIERLRGKVSEAQASRKKCARQLSKTLEQVRQLETTCTALRTALELANMCVTEKDRLLLLLTQRRPKRGKVNT